jgi:hypothetical protein
MDRNGRGRNPDAAIQANRERVAESRAHGRAIFGDDDRDSRAGRPTGGASQDGMHGGRRAHETSEYRAQATKRRKGKDHAKFKSEGTEKEESENSDETGSRAKTPDDVRQ